MIFNNAHEDCKKLTPEIVNTESGKYLHQFEWTDKISEIPDCMYLQKDMIPKKLTVTKCVSLYKIKPLIEGMDTSQIEHLNIYERLLNKHIK